MRRGQAAVEAVALAPLLVAALLALVAALGREAAAVAAARAAGAGVAAAGDGADPARAARAALPRALARHARIEISGGLVRVRLGWRVGALALRADASAPLAEGP